MRQLQGVALLCVTLVVLLIWTTESDGFAISSILSIVGKVASMAGKVGKGFMGHTWGVCLFKAIEVGWNALFGTLFPKEDKVGETLKEIMEKFDEVESLISSTTIQTIESVSSNLMITSKLAVVFDKIDKCIIYLNSQMQKMRQFQYQNVTNETWNNFAWSVVSKVDKNSVFNQMEDVFQTVTSNKSILTNSFLKDYIDYYKRAQDNKRCELVTSPQQTFIEFFRKIYLAETKTYILTTFAYRILAALGSTSNYTMEMELSTENFMNRTFVFNDVMQKNAKGLKRDFWLCDTKGSANSFQMNKLIYGYVEAEYGFKETCNSECKDYKNNGLTVAENAERMCSGFLSKCRSTKSYKFDYCYSQNELVPYMYTWMDNDEMKTGSKDVCLDPINKPIHVQGYTSNVYYCDYCVCDCHSEDDETHRFLSLLPQMSNIYENKVIIGVKFTKYQSKLISLQVIEAPLQPFGFVDESKAEWRQLDPLLLPTNFWNFSGYYTISAQIRAMRMKQLEGPENTVLTGIKFVVKNDVPDISIRFTHFNFTSGIMNPNMSVWITETHDDPEAKDYSGQNAIGACALQSFPDTESGQKVLLGASGFEVDAGSNIVPFFDAQPVVPKPMMALSGAGIYHKGSTHCGGLIAPIVTTLPERYFVDPEIDSPNKSDPF